MKRVVYLLLAELQMRHGVRGCGVYEALMRAAEACDRE